MSICGAIVSLTIVSETKKVYEYHTRPRKTKTVGTQHGQPSNQPVRSIITRNTPVKNSPKKLKRKKKSTNVASTKVHNLPGKAKKTTLKPKTPKKKRRENVASATPYGNQKKTKYLGS